MINNISENTLRIASKIDPSGAIHEKEVTQQKAKELSDARPVEKSEAGAQAHCFFVTTRLSSLRAAYRFRSGVQFFSPAHQNVVIRSLVPPTYRDYDITI